MATYINLIVLEPALILQERGVYRPNQQLTPGVLTGGKLPHSGRREKTCWTHVGTVGDRATKRSRSAQSEKGLLAVIP
jgi:hypothetical protein